MYFQSATNLIFIRGRDIYIIFICKYQKLYNEKTFKFELYFDFYKSSRIRINFALIIGIL